MGFIDFFKPKKMKAATTSRWKELGSYYSAFYTMGKDIYKSDVVRSCIRPLADFTSKAHVRCSNPKIEKILNGRPNLYMNGRDFLQKIRIRYELYNTCMIYIQRDERASVTGFYPVPYASFEALEYQGNLFIRFAFDNGSTLVLPWDDIAVVRKDYNKSDIAGDENDAIRSLLEVINTSNQGIANAIKSTANLRGILKSTKAMLADEDIKKQKEKFVKDYLNLENSGGIASLDATQEFTPIKMEPVVADANQMKEFREGCYRYFGVNDAIVMGTMTPEQIESFYELRIEPFLVALSDELANKCFTAREMGFNAFLVYEANRLQFASVSSKLSLIQLVDRGIMTPNELREVFNLSPYDGGDDFIRRLDTTTTGDSTNSDSKDGKVKENSEEEGDNND